MTFEFIIFFYDIIFSVVILVFIIWLLLCAVNLYFSFNFLVIMLSNEFICPILRFLNLIAVDFILSYLFKLLLCLITIFFDRYYAFIENLLLKFTLFFILNHQFLMLFKHYIFVSLQFIEFQKFVALKEKST
jgi:hypothetical protein